MYFNCFVQCKLKHAHSVHCALRFFLFALLLVCVGHTQCDRCFPSFGCADLGNVGHIKH